MELFELFSIIGTVAFAVSGALVAMEEEYDVLGVVVLGLATAFGGGILRNILIGVPVTTIWTQGPLMLVACISIAAAFLVPVSWIRHWKRAEAWLDAIGLGAFAIQGALYAVKMNHPVSAVAVAALLTGVGGGIIRDLLAGRKPVVLRDEIYAVWAIIGGLAVAFGWSKTTAEMIVLFVVIVCSRMLSVHYRWKLPRRSLKNSLFTGKTESAEMSMKEQKASS
ncbi:trimeric intracellular cation channel family protein [Paenibacillus pinistramenti]|uniref:trimeric intracellular cation channel family protein n=1 Tax=Paenibacillus pinistramenti TaxID=1768003 RepID=UPI0011093EBB|nr:trimeric intracellular cation channel family protein [Paenibacillus pinistramenti]